MGHIAIPPSSANYYLYLASTRPINTFTEQRYGQDFGQVLVYADAKAVESANAIDALAYTVQLDLPLGKDQYTQHDCNERYSA